MSIVTMSEFTRAQLRGTHKATLHSTALALWLINLLGLRLGQPSEDSNSLDQPFWMAPRAPSRKRSASLLSSPWDRLQTWLGPAAQIIDGIRPIKFEQTFVFGAV